MTTIDQGKLNDFVNRAIGDISSAYGGIMVSLGAKLGLYKAMQGAGPLTSREVAARAKCAERYVREWLDSQVAGGYVHHHASSGTYELTPEQAMVLADEDSPVYIPNAWNVPASMWADEHKAVDAFRTGNGIPWSSHDGRLFCGVAAFYKNGYKASLVQEWLPALEDVVDQLEAGITVADVGCGYGHSTVLMARAFAKSRFVGFDGHAPSLDEAKANAKNAGVSARTKFELASATNYPGSKYGLICFFDAFHDMGDPLGVAERAYEALADDGTIMLVEPFAHDHVGDNIGPVARLYYSASTMICCAHAISDGGKTVLGAQAGEARLAEVFRKAGFTHFRRAAATPFNLILEVRK